MAIEHFPSALGPRVEPFVIILNTLLFYSITLLLKLNEGNKIQNKIKMEK